MIFNADLNYLFEDIMGHDDELIKPMNLSNRQETLRAYVFDFDYPVDDIYKPILEKVFVSRFWFREIGFENYTRWQYELQNMLNVNGRRYNNLFKAQLDDIHEAIQMYAMETETDSDTTQDTTNTGTGSSDSHSESFNVNRASDTPQGRTDINSNYISALSDAKQIAESKGSSKETSNQSTKAGAKAKSKTTGYSGMPLVQLHRLFAEQSVIATDYVMYELNQLFSQVIL